jgi:hypothetical protein
MFVPVVTSEEKKRFFAGNNMLKYAPWLQPLNARCAIRLIFE